MSKAISLTRTAFLARERQIEILRSAIVLGCAMSLILAGQAVPV